MKDGMSNLTYKTTPTSTPLEKWGCKYPLYALLIAVIVLFLMALFGFFR